ncbi:MAG TPA: S41 family peptidase, partial [Bdellovibrionota bacterium]|nr:S41 family peptidase [Bdellovibrionota bacterium]
VVNRWQPPTELSIEEVYTDGPSAGLLEAGDRIVGINQKSFGALSLERILSVLEGSDPVTLQILGRTDWIEVQPEQFRASPIFSKRIHEGEANLGYTHIRRFTLDVSVRLQHALEKFEEQNVSALIIDLRGDGGGDTNEVVRCADLFVDQGVLLRLRGSGKKGIPAEFQINAVLGAETGGEVTRKPVVILVDARTASSAEMFAGVLAESSRAVLVGYEGGTFGKWTGQSIAKLGEKNGFGGRLVLTTFRVTLFDGADAQANGYPVHFKVSDPKLEQVVADRRKNNVTTILQERDYGADLVIPSTGRAVRAGSGSAIASIIDGTREAVDPELIQAACRPEEDCEYKVAVQVAADLADRKPEWPEIRTKLDE